MNWGTTVAIAGGVRAVGWDEAQKLAQTRTPVHHSVMDFRTSPAQRSVWPSEARPEITEPDGTVTPAEPARKTYGPDAGVVYGATKNVRVIVHSEADTDEASWADVRGGSRAKLAAVADAVYGAPDHVLWCGGDRTAAKWAAAKDGVRPLIDSLRAQWPKATIWLAVEKDADGAALRLEQLKAEQAGVCRLVDWDGVNVFALGVAFILAVEAR